MIRSTGFFRFVFTLSLCTVLSACQNMPFQEKEEVDARRMPVMNPPTGAVSSDPQSASVVIPPAPYEPAGLQRQDMMPPPEVNMSVPPPVPMQPVTAAETPVVAPDMARRRPAMNEDPLQQIVSQSSAPVPAVQAVAPAEGSGMKTSLWSDFFKKDSREPNENTKTYPTLSSVPAAPQPPQEGAYEQRLNELESARDANLRQRLDNPTDNGNPGPTSSVMPPAGSAPSLESFVSAPSAAPQQQASLAPLVAGSGEPVELPSMPQYIPPQGAGEVKSLTVGAPPPIIGMAAVPQQIEPEDLRGKNVSEEDYDPAATSETQAPVEAAPGVKLLPDSRYAARRARER